MEEYIRGKMSNKIWRLDVDASVRKKMQRIPVVDADAIEAAIDRMSLDPYRGDVEKMKGEENAWRRRVRAYRLFLRIYPGLRRVFVYKLERRTSTTY